MRCKNAKPCSLFWKGGGRLDDQKDAMINDECHIAIKAFHEGHPETAVATLPELSDLEMTCSSYRPSASTPGTSAATRPAAVGIIQVDLQDIPPVDQNEEGDASIYLRILQKFQKEKIVYKHIGPHRHTPTSEDSVKLNAKQKVK